MLADFHWLRPAWLLAVPLVVLAAVLFARGRLDSGNWRNVIDPALMPYVLSRAPGRGADYRWWLLAIGGVLAALALAGPAWQRIEQPVFRAEQALVVALDLSRSMDAQDISPSRLARARLKILDILARRKSGQTALVVYSSNAFTVTPLTTDTDTVAALVNSLSTDIMPSRGSNPVVAIEKGRQLLDQAGVGYGEVLLITDGGSSAATEKVARELKSAGYTLSVLAVGTREGAPIPRASGGFVTDNRGRIAVPRLEETALRALAAAGGGRFAVLSADNRDLDILLSGEVITPAASAESLATDQWREEGPWLLLLLLPFAALAFRRGWVLILLVFIAPQTAEASLWDDLWRNRNQQAQKQLEAGNAEAAIALFEDPEWRAVARYRAKDYAGSAAEFAERGDARSFYNLGNAMAYQGEFDSAIDAYEQVLEMEPDNEDAAYNLELIKNLKNQQQQQQENQGDQQQQGDGQEGEGEPSDSESQPGQEGSEGSSAMEDQSAESDASQRGNEEMSDEDLEALQRELQRAAEEAQTGEKPEQLSAAELAELRQQQEQEQAMEQWLRRIPDDPGGLLRRKFRHQYQRSGKDQDGNDVWPDNEAQPW
ncbi:MAG: VWA domain-containing protein [Gammaproteobacteria bacterium]|nr:VWA domain-containing protein [Gammaproteobacteria bacterium]MDH3363689.1 VWA domain-containing protein [Gammaproteobacteria bacterium]MDH3482244.1 VWA domain-containing protein [Gammaproteobacteria bacterium]